MKHITNILVLLALLGAIAAPAHARRNSIDGIQWFTAFSGQALTTSSVTSTLNIPLGKTEGVTAVIGVTGMGPTDTVTVSRLERVSSDETVWGYSVPVNTQPDIVITQSTAGPIAYQIAVDEGCESFTFKAVSSAASGNRISILVGTQ